MSRYIDADALLKHTTDHEMISTHLIYNAPTADVVEVKHGKNICDTVIGHCEFKCSICGADALSVSCGSLDGGNFNYCPNCGADMRGGSNDGR